MQITIWQGTVTSRSSTTEGRTHIGRTIYSTRCPEIMGLMERSIVAPRTGARRHSLKNMRVRLQVCCWGLELRERLSRLVDVRGVQGAPDIDNLFPS